ncbi:hypothetical protein HNQ80_001348 [Anaerosolibacter carboniphilus]|uniref:Spo0E like sporulation regulatory protein n=1 Tax=Anaerosolibacter carboniphilus TaxID=1417629 RepID=A0A841KYP4_9FIRM|nr:aspartyl-phosphate phosphatase Spo0E family protein [Anaerosolibacter carboniphilus]MBB6215259.1 hypothetical protein [Anaerosolibacter carboniphilus]
METVHGATEVIMEIEKMRNKMYALIEEDHQMKNPQILWASQKIDALLLKYYELIHRNG